MGGWKVDTFPDPPPSESGNLTRWKVGEREDGDMGAGAAGRKVVGEGGAEQSCKKWLHLLFFSLLFFMF